jgi:hypothetical protein
MVTKISTTPEFQDMIEEAIDTGIMNNACMVLLKRLKQCWSSYPPPPEDSVLEFSVPVESITNIYGDKF